MEQNNAVSQNLGATKKNKKIILPTLILIVAAVGILAYLLLSKNDKNKDQPVQSDENYEYAQDFFNGNDKFAINILKELQDEDNNIFISPSSISMALGMTLNGASGNTKKEMLKTLGLENLDLTTINENYKNLIDGLNTDDDNFVLKIANSVWIRDNFSFKQAFLDNVSSSFNAELKTKDFSDAKTADEINDWVSDKTSGKINQIVDKISDNAVMYLINATYFKAKWEKEFNPDSTEKGSFYLADDSTENVDFMLSEEDEYNYYEDENVQAVALPYKNNRYEMVIVLPNEETTLSKYLNFFNDSQWQDIIANMEIKEGTIEMPKFKLEYEMTLNEVLKTLGMEEAFNEDLADFTEMYDKTSENIYISEVLHKVFIEVNEEGTEAAAVTSVGMETTAMPIFDNFYIRVDRPFISAIRDTKTGIILFIGSVYNPIN